MNKTQPGYYTLGGRGPFKTRQEMYEFLNIPEPRNEYWKCPKCNKCWQQHELKCLKFGYSKSMVCPDCIFVSVEYYGKYTQSTIDELKV